MRCRGHAWAAARRRGGRLARHPVPTSYNPWRVPDLRCPPVGRRRSAVGPCHRRARDVRARRRRAGRAPRSGDRRRPGLAARRHRAAPQGVRDGVAAGGAARRAGQPRPGRRQRPARGRDAGTVAPAGHRRRPDGPPAPVQPAGLSRPGRRRPARGAAGPRRGRPLLGHRSRHLQDRRTGYDAAHRGADSRRDAGPGSGGGGRARAHPGRGHQLRPADGQRAGQRADAAGLRRARRGPRRRHVARRADPRRARHRGAGDGVDRGRGARLDRAGAAADPVAHAARRHRRAGARA